MSKPTWSDVCSLTLYPDEYGDGIDGKFVPLPIYKALLDFVRVTYKGLHHSARWWGDMGVKESAEILRAYNELKEMGLEVSDE